MSELFVGIYSHRHGVDVAGYPTADDAYHGLALAVLDGLGEEFERGEKAAISRRVVDLYKDGHYSEVVVQFNALNNRDSFMEVRVIDVRTNPRLTPQEAEEFVIDG